jgi:hypothetical protein
VYHVLYLLEDGVTWTDHGQSDSWGDAWAFARVLRRVHAKVKIVDGNNGMEWNIG